MNQKLYDLMNWPEIEGVVYSDTDHPKKLLGQHKVKGGMLVQSFHPGAVKATLKTADGKKHRMEQVDEAGYFAVLVSSKTELDYTIVYEFEDKHKFETVDPYSIPSQLDRGELRAFNSGTSCNAEKILGAHPMKINGAEGTYFAVWAPNALRVSVVGDFDSWDGRMYQMEKDDESGVFELFVPYVKPGDIYKYEIRFKGNLTGLKADPYAFSAELRPNNASIVFKSDYKWNDDKWMANRNASDNSTPMSIYEMYLGSFKAPEDEEREYCNYRELAPLVIDYVKKMGYTHVELLPVMEHPFDGSWGYQVTGYYAPTARYGSPDDFKYFVDELHKAGIGVILDWVPAHFPKDAFGLAKFDGTCLYEHWDPRKGEHPHWGTLIYNYGRPEVKSFLTSNAVFWANEYHADGIRMDAVASMLYLDYGKQNGEWVANKYGGKENLEAIDFLKNLSNVFHEKCNGSVLIAEESTAWPMVTGDVKDGSLGFDYKWNMGWMNDFLDFMKCDPLFRKGRYGELTFSMIYAYSEKFILVISHDEVVHGKCSMLNKMPGSTKKEKMNNLRAAYGFMFTHPGRKLLFMGQDFGMEREWSEEREIDWNLTENEENRQLALYVHDLNELYIKETAFHELDYSPEGFEWINNISADECIVVYVRKSSNGDKYLVAVNFTPVTRIKYKVGVPGMGKYKEIFSSDDIKYGGAGNINRRVINSRKDECDGREDSITLTVPPMGMTILRYTEADTMPKKRAVSTSGKSTKPVRKNTKKATK